MFGFTMFHHVSHLFLGFFLGKKWHLDGWDWGKQAKITELFCKSCQKYATPPKKNVDIFHKWDMFMEYISIVHEW
jgi:hypothetical protein